MSFICFSFCYRTASLDSQLLTIHSEWPTIPQIYVNGEFVGGCDILLSSEWFPLEGEHDDLYAYYEFLVHQSGELEELLEKHKVIAPVEESETINASPST